MYGTPGTYSRGYGSGPVVRWSALRHRLAVGLWTLALVLSAAVVRGQVAGCSSGTQGQEGWFVTPEIFGVSKTNWSFTFAGDPVMSGTATVAVTVTATRDTCTLLTPTQPPSGQIGVGTYTTDYPTHSYGCGVEGYLPPRGPISINAPAAGVGQLLVPPLTNTTCEGHYVMTATVNGYAVRRHPIDIWLYDDNSGLGRQWHEKPPANQTCVTQGGTWVPPSANGSNTSLVNVTWTMNGSPVQSKTVTLNDMYGNTVANMATNAGGIASLGPISVSGDYVATATATLNKSGGGTVVVSWSRNVHAVIGVTYNITVASVDAGTSTFTQGESTDSNGSGTWLSQILQDLFIPSQSYIDALKLNVSNFLNWGPFTLINQIANLGSNPASGQAAIGVPVSYYNAGTGGSVYVYTAPIDVNALTSYSWWSEVRMLEGALVWIVFVLVLVKRLTPQHQV